MTLPIGPLALLTESIAPAQPTPAPSAGFANALAAALGGEGAAPSAALMPTMFAGFLGTVVKPGAGRGDGAGGTGTTGGTPQRTRGSASPTFPTQQPLAIGVPALGIARGHHETSDDATVSHNAAVVAGKGEAGASSEETDGGESRAPSDAATAALQGMAGTADLSALVAALGATDATRLDAIGAPGGTIDLRELVRTLRETGDPLAIRRDLRELLPDFRSRLETLIQRMQEEFGYHVEVVEAVRSQPRQEMLFAQGRSTPGPVVTWTRDSLHTQGRAADVTINGGYDDAQAFARLAVVAREMGLRTLGPRDPGHVELTGARASHEALAHTPAPAPTRASSTESAPGSSPAIPTRAAARAGVDVPHLDAPALRIVPDGRDGGVRRSVLPNDAGLRPTATPVQAPAASAPAAQTAAPREMSGGMATVAPVARVASVAQVAPVAAVAQPAAVAQVARVATVARVGAPGAPSARSTARAAEHDDAIDQAPIARDVASAEHVAPSRSASTSGTRGLVGRNAEVARATTLGVLTDAVANALGVPGAKATDASRPATANGSTTVDDANGIGQRVQPNDARTERDTRHDARGEGNAEARAEARVELASTSRSDLLMTATDGAGDVRGAESVSRSDAAERIARLLQTREHAAERPLSSVLLRLDHPEGGEDRVRVDLRGHSVAATLDVRDPVAAERLSAHAAELTQALERQGLDPQNVTIRTARAADNASVAAQSAVADRESGRVTTSSSTGQGSFTGREQRPSSRPDQDRDDTPRQRGRRTPQGDR